MTADPSANSSRTTPSSIATRRTSLSSSMVPPRLLESGRERTWDPVHARDRYPWRLEARVVAAEEVLDRIPGVVRIESRVVAEGIRDESVALRTPDRRQGVLERPLGDWSVQVGDGRPRARASRPEQVSRAPGTMRSKASTVRSIAERSRSSGREVVPGARHGIARAAADPSAEERAFRPCIERRMVGSGCRAR